MYFSLPPLRRSRHPLVRVLSLLIGAAVLGVLLVFGLMISAVLLVGGGLWLVWRQWRRGRVAAPGTATASAHQPAVLEGEFVVIRQGRPVAH